MSETLYENLEHVLRGWHRYEIELGNSPVVDFDCAPAPAPAALGRLDAYRRLRSLLERRRRYASSLPRAAGAGAGAQSKSTTGELPSSISYRCQPRRTCSRFSYSVSLMRARLRSETGGDRASGLP
ncbi:hypothetical protein SALBM311S_05984 [Streptomyces alboniger]